MENNTSIKNNLELVDKIRAINIPAGAKFASFDVVNMYTNIPVKDTLSITADLLRKNNVEDDKISEVIKLLTTVTDMNYFKHNNKFYTQPEGLPMGSPLSGTLANIYLNYFENTYILSDKNPYKNHILYWHRYVDDVLLLFRGTHRQLDKLLHYINAIQTKIKFTLEIEINNSINFLDLTIKNINQKHNFNVYRKPTQTNHTICNSSYHPYTHKLSAYSHMLNRLNNVPLSNDDYIEELNTIKYIAIVNGYNTNLIDRMNTKIKYRVERHNLTTLYNSDDNPNSRFITTEYDKNTSNVLKRILHKHGYKIAYKNSHKLMNKLKTSTNNQELDTGVYKLLCNDCNKFYLGQTGRSFETRFKEHTKEVGQSHIKSNYALHLTDENHTYTSLDENLKVLCRMQKGQNLDRREELEIYKHRNNPLLLNDKINTRTNKLYDLILNNYQHQ